jgi:Rrf2 family protein
MQITRQADYALRTMLFLARLEPSTQTPTHRIAEEMQIPKSFLAKIISQLSVASLINTVRGAKGGVCLTRNTDEISVYEVVVSIDGPMHLNECTFDPHTCPFGETCPIHQVWCETEKILVEKLKNTSLTELLQREAQKPS